MPFPAFEKMEFPRKVFANESPLPPRSLWVMPSPPLNAITFACPAAVPPTILWDVSSPRRMPERVVVRPVAGAVRRRRSLEDAALVRAVGIYVDGAVGARGTVDGIDAGDAGQKGVANLAIGLGDALACVVVDRVAPDLVVVVVDAYDDAVDCVEGDDIALSGVDPANNIVVGGRIQAYPSPTVRERAAAVWLRANEVSLHRDTVCGDERDTVAGVAGDHVSLACGGPTDREREL